MTRSRLSIIFGLLLCSIFLGVLFSGCLSGKSVGDNNASNGTNEVTVKSHFSKIYDVSGTDSRYGAYKGLVELRTADEEPNFIRVIKFDELSFPDPRLNIDYDVYTAWTGELDAAKNAVRVELKVADFIRQYDGVERTSADGEPVVVEGTIVADKDEQFTVTYESTEDSPHSFTATETWNYKGIGHEKPMFVYEDKFVASHEPMPEGLRTALWALLADYHALDFYDDYRDREEFELAVHYFPHFRTDFAWYRENKGAIRVVNKWLDEISMAESMERRRAYAPTLAEKASAFDSEMPVLYLNSLGMVSSALIGSDPLVQSESGDGLLWTGGYIGGQVFRYLTTGEQEALDNWLFALEGLFLCHDIVQDPTIFARSVRLHVEDGNTNWVHGTGPYEDYDWLCCGNNDMIQGLYYGYLLSYIFLPDDSSYDSYREKIAERAMRLADSCEVAQGSDFNNIKANWLAYLATGNTVYRDRYQALWSKQSLKFWVNAGSGMFYVWGISDWSGQHLNTIGQLILWFLAYATEDEESLDLLKEGWINGMRTNGVTRQVLWPVAAYSLANPPAELDKVFDEAIWGLRESPFPKQNFDIDRRIDPAWCASPLPELFWKFDWSEGGRHQGLYATPSFERGVADNDYTCNPLSFAATESDWSEGGGSDYLHTYWLGRYYGVIGEDD